MRVLVPGLVSMLASFAPVAYAQVVRDVPEDMQGTGVQQKVGAQIPLDLAFTDDHGLPVTLAKYFDGTKPILLTLNYSNCPMLCSEMLNSMVATLRDVDLEPGKDYAIVTVSIDETELWMKAQSTKRKYLDLLDRAGGADGWHFLVGHSASIDPLAQAVGFGFKKVEGGVDYAHSAALIFCTPKGVVSHYMAGIAYDARDIRMSFLDAGSGTIGSLVDQVFLSCYYYDHTKGTYSVEAQTVMQYSAGLTLLAIGALYLWLRRTTANSPHPSTSAEAT
ncbi:MAG: SCO family protein [Planctomycetes bacterium]|nr:SCO family protein [Planctomycetota bacterium]